MKLTTHPFPRRPPPLPPFPPLSTAPALPPPPPPIHSEVTAEGKRATKLDQILLNGNNIVMLVPGGNPETAEGGVLAAAAAVPVPAQ
jgi:hypothetical protein